MLYVQFRVTGCPSKTRSGLEKCGVIVTCDSVGKTHNFSVTKKKFDYPLLALLRLACVASTRREGKKENPRENEEGARESRKGNTGYIIRRNDDFFPVKNVSRLDLI